MTNQVVFSAALKSRLPTQLSARGLLRNLLTDLYAHDIQQLPATDDMAVDHVKYLKLLLVKFICSRRTTILDQDHVETFIRQAAYRR